MERNSLEVKKSIQNQCSCEKSEGPGGQSMDSGEKREACRHLHLWLVRVPPNRRGRLPGEPREVRPRASAAKGNKEGFRLPASAACQPLQLVGLCSLSASAACLPLCWARISHFDFGPLQLARLCSLSASAACQTCSLPVCGACKFQSLTRSINLG